MPAVVGRREPEEAAAAHELQVVGVLAQAERSGGADDVGGDAAAAVLDDGEHLLVRARDGEDAGDARAVGAQLREAVEEPGQHVREGRAGSVEVGERKRVAAAAPGLDAVEGRAVCHPSPPLTSARSCWSAGRSKPAGERPPARKSGLMIAHASSQ